ncbi:GAF domain-containing protein [Enterovirga rhinocerotis]|uniref:GAF domain-containing protein n=1 Tax=Enterovirga rhinocerotis TaxID=1339210 RepID=A0A4R7BJI7_9HYPH|nr:GAF domain-containing protein [Enterovirga rhinocerotis]
MRGSGLTIVVVETLDDIGSLLDPAPPALIVVENADQSVGKQLVRKLARDERFRATTIIGLVADSGSEAVSRDLRYIQLGSLPDIAATSAAIVAKLISRLPAPNDQVRYRVPWNEPARLKAVGDSGLVGSAAEESFDRLVRLAAYSTRSPIAMFTLLTESEQWFKSHVGFEAASTPRDWAFCNETLISNELTIFEDLSKANMFERNPALAEPFGFRFYAGAPVRNPLGFALGSICVIDIRPRKLAADERDALTTIAEATSNLIRLKALERLLPGRS